MEEREIRNMTENEMHRLKEFLKLSCGRQKKIMIFIYAV